MNTPIIEVEGLVKAYRGGVRALDGLSLGVEPGIVYGLLGPNGAGKTTLIHILATLLTPDAGTARVAGRDVVADPRGVRARIGLAGQYAAVDDHLTGAENIAMIGRLYGLTRAEVRRRTPAILDRAGLGEAAARPARTYSGGMRRRLDLAASLIGRPPVLFLDEPTTGVDPVNRRHLWELVTGLVADGTTVLLTTQYLDEADRLAARIAVIADGRLVREGTPAELKARTGNGVIELTVAPGEREQAVSALGGLLPGAARKDGRLRLPAVDGSRTLHTALGRLADAGITATEAAMRTPTLDDVFLDLTGARASERRAA